VQRLVLRFVRRPLDRDRAVLEREQHIRVQDAADLALRTLHRDFVPVDLRGYTFRQRDRLSPDS